MDFKQFIKFQRDFIQLSAQHTRDLIEVLPNARAPLHCSLESLQALRNERLRGLLRYAKSHSPWYQKQLAHLNIDHFTEQNLSEIPTMTKVTLMNHWDEIVTDRKLSLKRVEQHIETISRDENELYLNGKYHVITTSGSSGVRGIFIYDWDEWNQFYTNLVRYGFNTPEGSTVFFEPASRVCIAVVNIANPIFSTYSLHKTFHFQGIDKFHFPITLPFNQVVSGLNRTQPQILIGLPPTLYQLCQEASIRKLSIQPKVISSFGEPLSLSVRSMIRKTWPDASVFNTYSTSEGLVGMNCRANRHEMHLNDDACIVELVDDQGNPVRNNTRSSKVYLTNLYNYTLPLIRYELADQLLALDKVCECGVSHQLIAEPLYRPEFDFTYSGNLIVHHSVFDTALLLEKNVREFQVVQTRQGVDVKIATIGVVNRMQLKTNIADELRKIGLSDPIVTINEVEHIDYPASGKLRRFLRL